MTPHSYELKSPVPLLVHVHVRRITVPRSRMSLAHSADHCGSSLCYLRMVHENGWAEDMPSHLPKISSSLLLYFWSQTKIFKIAHNTFPAFTFVNLSQHPLLFSDKATITLVTAGLVLVSPIARPAQQSAVKALHSYTSVIHAATQQAVPTLVFTAVMYIDSTGLWLQGLHCSLPVLEVRL